MTVSNLPHDPAPTGRESGSLLHNLVLFGRVLRGLGIEVNPGRMIEVSQALQFVQISQKSDFYHTLRSLLVNRRHDLEKFDMAFDLFWKRPTGGGLDVNLQDLLTDRLRQEEPARIVTPPPLETSGEEPIGEPDEEEAESIQEVIEVTRTYSARELLLHKDFADLTAAETEAIKRVIAQLIWQLGERRTRRMKPGEGRLLDLRRSLRRSFRYGGELLEWRHRVPKVKPRPLVVLADISGSMERYTRLLIHFLYSLAEGMAQRVEVFTFGTRLTHITRQLNNRDIDRAIDDVSYAVQDWSGGTRIGEALKTFNFTWSRRVLRGGAIVLLISDGWDRGDPRLLRREIARLNLFCHRLIWLNPLLGSDRYEPLTRGLVAALPYIDDFLPVNNLSSLETLADHLLSLDSGKTGRKSRLRGAAFIGRRR